MFIEDELHLLISLIWKFPVKTYFVISSEWYCYIIVIYEGLYFDLAQGQMNGAPNETWTHSCRFASLTC